MFGKAVNPQLAELKAAAPASPKPGVCLKILLEDELLYATG